MAGFILQLMAWDEGSSLAPSQPPSMISPLTLFMMGSPHEAAPVPPGEGSKNKRSVSSGVGGSRYGVKGGRGGGVLSPPYFPRSKEKISVLQWAASAQLDELVLRVKGLREAISVRCLHAK